ncbi:MAG: DUF2393 family protein [Campylobacteraceae bacterium]|nr:DUF2393 family protein [Campylobacteraceae bacterium]
MTAETLKISFLFYLKNLSLYDYLALGWLVVTFFILIFLAILVARKSSALALLLIIISLIIFIIAPFLIKMKLNDYLRPIQTEVLSVKKLTFSDSLIIEGQIKNNATKNFTKCLVQTSILKDLNTTNTFKSYMNQLNPIANKSIVVEQSLLKEDFMEYEIVFDDFDYTGNVLAHINAECY